MKRFLDRFYLSFNFSYAVATALLFFNNKSIVDNVGFQSNFNFFVIFLSFIALTTSLMLFEIKILKHSKQLLIIYGLLALIFPLFAVLKGLETLRIVLTVVILVGLLVKAVVFNYKQASFKVSNFYSIPRLYLGLLLTIVFINLASTNFITSIFLLVPVLMVEVEFYLKLKSNDLINNLKLLGTIFLVLTTFFVSYYGVIDLELPRLSFGVNIALPVISFGLAIYLSSIIKLRVEQIVSSDTIK